MKSIDIDIDIDIFSIIAVRKTVYGFLSRSFSHEIDQAFLEQAKKYLPMLNDLKEKTDNPDYINGVSRMEAFFNNIQDDNEFIEEYARRFVSVFLHISNDSNNIDPYESIYLSRERLLMQESRDQVVEFYAEYGHGVIDTFKEPEDHIAAELGFLASINGEILKDIESGKDMTESIKKLEGQLEFLNTHLLLWLPLLSRDLQSVDPSGLYTIFGELAHGFCRIDTLFLEELVEYLKAK